MANCPKCGADDPRRYYAKPCGRSKGRWFYKCRKCRRQFSIRTGTPRFGSHVPKEKWDAAVTLFREGKSALFVAEHIGVTDRTAQRMKLLVTLYA